uniref:Uncharacterized protein n=1 Tax=Electrophorus electricus TaxID=8005 RepID=A0A4W4FDU7_ELEEL
MTSCVCGCAHGTRGEMRLKAQCTPGFSQSFYALRLSRSMLEGRSLLKGKAGCCFNELCCVRRFSRARCLQGFKGPVRRDTSIMPDPRSTRALNH